MKKTIEVIMGADAPIPPLRCLPPLPFGRPAAASISALRKQFLSVCPVVVMRRHRMRPRPPFGTGLARRVVTIFQNEDFTRAKKNTKRFPDNPVARMAFFHDGWQYTFPGPQGILWLSTATTLLIQSRSSIPMRKNPPARRRIGTRSMIRIIAEMSSTTSMVNILTCSL